MISQVGVKGDEPCAEVLAGPTLYYTGPQGSTTGTSSIEISVGAGQVGLTTRSPVPPAISV